MKKQFILSILLSLISCQLSFGQKIQFSKLYPLDSGFSAGRYLRITEAEKKNVILVEIMGNSKGANQLSLVKIDSIGDTIFTRPLLWKNIFSYEPYYIFYNPAGYYEASILRVGISVCYLHRKRFTFSGITILDDSIKTPIRNTLNSGTGYYNIQRNTTGIMTVQSHGDTNIISMLDTFCNLKWTQNFLSGNPAPVASETFSFNDNGYLQTYFYTKNNSSYCIFYLLDSKGNVVIDTTKSFPVNYGITGFIPYGNNKYYLFLNEVDTLKISNQLHLKNWLWELDSKMNVVLKHQITSSVDTASASEFFTRKVSPVITPDSGLAIISYDRDSTYPQTERLLKYDRSFKFQWELNLDKYITNNPKKIFRLPSIYPMKDGAFYMFGSDTSNFPLLVKIGDSSITGIKENYYAANKIKIYPNPANNYFNVDFANETSGSFSIFNNLGQKIYSQVFMDKKTLNISTNELSKGMYFIQFIDSKSSVRTTGKIIKE